MGKTDNSAKECSECKSTFIRQSDMIRHIKRFHSKKAEKLISAMENKIHPFKCDQCDKRFYHKKNLHLHSKSHVADVMNTGVLIRKKCPLCEHVATFKKDFYDHCRDAHNILLDVEKMDFATMEDFVNWKSEIEKALNSRFVKEYGSTAKMTNYICSQSEYTLTDNDIEIVASPEKSKVNGFCPAGFRVMHEENSKCSIYFVKTHICHQNKNLIFPSPVNEEITESPKSKLQKVKENNVSTHKATEPEKPKNNHETHIEVRTQTVSPPPQNDKTEKTVRNSKKRSFTVKKKEMIRNVLSTLNTISNITELEAVQELLNPIKPILEILKKKSVNTSSSQIKPPKKKLISNE